MPPRRREPSDSSEHTPTTLFVKRQKRRLEKDLRVLRVTAGPDLLSFAALENGVPLTIGRDDECPLRLDDKSVSRRHARVTATPEGVRIEDLGSTNGTFVNGNKAKTSALVPGDRIEIGNVPMRYDLLSAEELLHLRTIAERLEAADRDPLTGLLTRAWLDDGLPKLVEGAAEAKAPICCVFVDLDEFKGINDRFGHTVGDEVLRQVARLLMFSLRDGDTCVRYGGDEILAVLPGIEEAQATLVAERMRRSIGRHDWSHVAKGLAVGASCGVAERGPRETVKKWIARADGALYAAKKGGRNQARRASKTS